MSGLSPSMQVSAVAQGFSPDKSRPEGLRYMSNRRAYTGVMARGIRNHDALYYITGGGGIVFNKKTVDNGNQQQAQSNTQTWVTWVALTTAAVAVLTAFTTLFMGKFSSRTMMYQAQESDQWAFYQAKSIKSHTYELQKQQLELTLESLKGRISKDLDAKYRDVIGEYARNVARYDTEKNEIKEMAEGHAKDKQVSQLRAGQFSFGLIFMQIALMMSSIAVITKKKPLWYLGIAVAALGCVFFINGMYLIF